MGFAIIVTACAWGVVLLSRDAHSVHINCGDLSWGQGGECEKAGKRLPTDGGLFAGGLILVLVFGLPSATGFIALLVDPHETIRYVLRKWCCCMEC
jgi:hypothetical protein